MFLFINCERKKNSSNNIKKYNPVNNTIPLNYTESDNLICLKEAQSDEKLYNYFYEMYNDDSLIEKYKKHYNEYLRFKKDTTEFRKTPDIFLKWLKEKINSKNNLRIYVIHYRPTQCDPIFIGYVEIEHQNNSSYYQFDDYSSKIEITINNCKKGYLSNLFDTLVKYENTKTDYESPLPGIIDFNLGNVTKYEKNCITTSSMSLHFSNRRYLQTALLSRKIYNLFYLHKEGLALDSIYAIEKHTTDSLQNVIANYKIIYHE